MRERFSKLLLGEDMSGGGKGVSSAAAISNAITNLYGTYARTHFLVRITKSVAEDADTISCFLCSAATVFGSCHRLEPLPAEKRSMWRREMDCLLSVCDYIVEFFPSKEILPDGTAREVMATRPRSDIYVNLPALEKLDDMLLVRSSNSLSLSSKGWPGSKNCYSCVHNVVCAGDPGRVSED
jgi:hypothetical protein